MSAYGTIDAAIAGLQLGMNTARIESGIAQEAIAFGEPVVGYQNVEGKVWGPHRDQATSTLAGDLVADNVITTTINGTAVASTYADSHAATMTAHIAAINANTTLLALGVVAAAGSGNRIIVIKVKGVDLTVTQAVTLGQSQTTATIVYGSWAKFLGVALFTQKSTVAAGAGASNYAQYDTVNILAEGMIYVPVSVAVEDKQAAYFITEVTNQGQFTNSSTLTFDCGCYFRSSRANSMAILEVRGLK